MKNKACIITAALLLVCLICGCAEKTHAPSAEASAAAAAAESSAASGKAGSKPVTRETFAMDTYMSLTAYGDRAEEAVGAAVDEIKRLDALLSVGDTESLVYKLNHKENISGSQDIAYLTEKSEWIYDHTNGAYDITIYPLLPAAFSSGFLGIKRIFTAVGSGGPISLDSMWVLALLLGFTIVFGRFFCGFVCSFGTLGDAVYALSGFVQKKLFKRKKQLSIPEKPTVILQKLKYIVLLAIVLLCAFGIYGKLSGWSPWDVFSRLLVFRLPGDGYAAGVILLILILIGMAFKKRFFCQFLCPMGAVFSLLPVLPVSKIHRNEENCIKGCSACRKNCPVNIRMGESMLRDGECISCEKCMSICPKKNLTKPENKVLKNDVVLLIIKAVVFFALGCLTGLCRFI